jgi:hypothetical protein
LVFHAQLVPQILRCLDLDFFVGSWIDAFCIFMLDLDPSNSGFGLGFEDFGWTPSFLVELSA